jgi:hypothetical protein
VPVVFIGFLFFKFFIVIATGYHFEGLWDKLLANV